MGEGTWPWQHSPEERAQPALALPWPVPAWLQVSPFLLGPALRPQGDAGPLTCLSLLPPLCPGPVIMPSPPLPPTHHPTSWPACTTPHLLPFFPLPSPLQIVSPAHKCPPSDWLEPILCPASECWWDLGSTGVCCPDGGGGRKSEVTVPLEGTMHRAVAQARQQAWGQGLTCPSFTNHPPHTHDLAAVAWNMGPPDQSQEALVTMCLGTLGPLPAHLVINPHSWPSSAIACCAAGSVGSAIKRLGKEEN